MCRLIMLSKNAWDVPKTVHIAVFILGYQYWEATSKFRGLSVCIEVMIYHLSQDFRGKSVNLGGISPPNSFEISTDIALRGVIVVGCTGNRRRWL